MLLLAYQRCLAWNDVDKRYLYQRKIGRTHSVEGDFKVCWFEMYLSFALDSVLCVMLWDKRRQTWQDKMAPGRLL